LATERDAETRYTEEWSMRLVTYRQTAEPRVGAVTDRGIIDLRDAVAGWLAQKGSGDPAGEAAFRVPSDMTVLLARAGNSFTLFAEAVAAPSAPQPLDPGAVALLAPVPRPGKIIGVGRNYGAHAAEGALERQEEPRLFTKFSSSVI
jgi:2-keto-4-pentenoate hydratase/2-oxohepta-3-ene-1,7-dioic acid hydratase in catechol pathway